MRITEPQSFPGTFAFFLYNVVMLASRPTCIRLRTFSPHELPVTLFSRWRLDGSALLLGVGFAFYRSFSLALLPEVIPPPQLISANSAVLLAVQGGMLVAGGLVGFVYERTGLAGILAIDAATYAFSALCFYLLRRGYFAPQVSPSPALFRSADFGARHAAREPGVLADLHEGLHYLRSQPTVLALGLTYACMMAGVISANVLVVALANNLLHVGARGYGFIQSGLALGAVVA